MIFFRVALTFLGVLSFFRRFRFFLGIINNFDYFRLFVAAKCDSTDQNQNLKKKQDLCRPSAISRDSGTVPFKTGRLVTLPITIQFKTRAFLI